AGDGHEGGNSRASSLPHTDHAYRFPFDDGVWPEATPGILIDNARAVYGEIAEGILARWGTEYNETLFSKGMRFSDGGKVVEDKMLNAVLEQGGFLAAFTGE
ncbi:unnamed protein product, partial [Sphacelaria rigidula]